MKMKLKMKLGLTRLMGPGLTLALVLSVMTAAPVRAQDDGEACRCVDGAGNEIENCTCLQMPRMDRLVGAMAFGASRPRLGISINTSQSASQDARGAVVNDVLEGGPADEAGLRDGDVITTLDGQSLTDPIGADAEEDFDLDQSVTAQRLLAIARELEPGQEIEVEYLRDGQRQTTILEAEDLSDSWGRSFTVAAPTWNEERFRDQMRALSDGTRGFRFRFDDMDELDELREFHFEAPPGADVSVFRGGAAPMVIDRLTGFGDGLELVEINPGLGAYFGTDQGVLVASVDSESGLGLEAGDVVLSIGDRAVDSPSRFHRILRSYGEDEDVALHLRRNGEEMTVTGRRQD
jgi:hypothetical protein